MEKYLVYEAQYSKDRPLIFIGNKESGNSEAPEFHMSSAVESLDFSVIMDRLEKHLEGFKFHNARWTLTEYCVPSQDINEIRARQEVVRDIYENKTIEERVVHIIHAARNLQRWTKGYLDKLNFGKTTEQVGYLVDFVQTSIGLRAQSERLRRIRTFARKIAREKDYNELKAYFSAASVKVFDEYEAVLDEIKNDLGIYDDKTKYTAAELIEIFDKIIAGKHKDKEFFNLLNVDTKRKFYHSFRNLQAVFDKLMHDPKLGHILDRREAQDFELEKEFDRGIKAIGRTSRLKAKRSVLQTQKEFFNQFRKVLQHIDELINESLVERMERLNVDTEQMDKELAFYYSLSCLAKDMAERSRIVMPTLLPAEERYCKITRGNIASFLVRTNRKRFVSNDVLFDKDYFVYVLTGANDNGKTTYERMVGQAQVLAQLGSYIPATNAAMSLVDAIFAFFGTKDDPKKKEGSFRHALNFLSSVTIPKHFDRGPWELAPIPSAEELKHVYERGNYTFFTPHSLLLFDEIAIGSDNKGTEEAIERALRAAQQRGTRLLISTHYHPVAEKVQNGELPNTMNLGAVMRRTRTGKLVVTYKIIRDRHEPSYGNRLFDEAGYTDKAIEQANKLLREAGIIH